jgi:hypothetical protein
MNQVPTTIVDFPYIVPNILDLPFEQAARPAAGLRRQEQASCYPEKRTCQQI